MNGQGTIQGLFHWSLAFFFFSPLPHPILSLLNSCSGSDTPSLFSQLPLIGMNSREAAVCLSQLVLSHLRTLGLCLSACGERRGVCSLGKAAHFLWLGPCQLYVDGAANWLLISVSMKICSSCFYSLCHWLSSWELLKSFLNNERKVGHDLIYLAVSLTVVLIDRLPQIWNLLSFL